MVPCQIREQKYLRLKSFQQRTLVMLVEFRENACFASQLEQCLAGFEVALDEQIKNQLRGIGRQLGASAATNRRQTEKRTRSLKLFAE
jgi:hypothetical protein